MGTTSPVTIHDEGTQHMAELAQSVIPCSMPSSLKCYRWQPPEATIAEVSYFPSKLIASLTVFALTATVFGAEEARRNTTSFHYWL